MEKNLCGENLCGEKMTNMRSDINCGNFANTWEAEAGATLEVVEVQTHFAAALLPPISPPASSQSPADSRVG